MKGLGKISTDPLLSPGGKIVLHFQPLDSTTPGAQIDVQTLKNRRDDLMLMQYDQTYSAARLNFDGVFASIQGHPQGGYVQVFRTGVAEEVDADLLCGRGDARNRIRAYQLEKRIINGTFRRLRLIRSLDVRSPVMVHLSILSLRGFTMLFDNLDPHRDLTFLNDAAEQNPIDRDDLILKGVLIDELPALDGLLEFSELLLHPLFNAIWNAAGFPRSLYYDNQGRWTGQLQLGNLNG